MINWLMWLWRQLMKVMKAGEENWQYDMVNYDDEMTGRLNNGQWPDYCELIENDRRKHYVWRRQIQWKLIIQKIMKTELVNNWIM